MLISSNHWHTLNGGPVSFKLWTDWCWAQTCRRDFNYSTNDAHGLCPVWLASIFRITYKKKFRQLQTCVFEDNKCARPRDRLLVARYGYPPPILQNDKSRIMKARVREDMEFISVMLTGAGKAAHCRFSTPHLTPRLQQWDSGCSKSPALSKSPTRYKDSSSRQFNSLPPTY